MFPQFLVIMFHDSQLNIFMMIVLLEEEDMIQLFCTIYYLTINMFNI